MTEIAIQNGQPVLRTETRGAVLVIELNRPHARNAFDLALATALSATLDRLDEEPELVAGVLTGSGSFSSGADLKALLRGERGFTEKRGGFGILKLPPDKPLIAAVEGHAVAGGFELALAADLIVAARDAKFGLPEVKRGLVAVGGGLFRLPRRIPYHLAMEIALTGEPVSAARLHALGLVNRVVEPGSALAVAVELAAADRRERPARGARDQADPGALPRMDRRSRLDRATPLRRSRAALRRRQGGAARLRRKARSGVEGTLAGQRREKVPTERAKKPFEHELNDAIQRTGARAFW